jgi:hypothetical protein
MEPGPDGQQDELDRFRQDLTREFGDRVPEGTLTRIASETWERFRGARLREFVPVFAWREARARLKALIIEPTQGFEGTPGAQQG